MNERFIGALVDMALVEDDGQERSVITLADVDNATDAILRVESEFENPNNGRALPQLVGLVFDVNKGRVVYIETEHDVFWPRAPAKEERR